MTTSKKKPARTSSAKRPSPAERALAALQEVHAHIRGEHVPGMVIHYPVDVAAIRKKTGLSQAKFAERFGLDVSAVRDWEQGRRIPDRAAQILLRVIDTNPKAVEKVVEKVA